MARKKAPKSEFPLELSEGSCRVKIYRGVNRGVEIFTLVYRLGDARKRQNFRKLEEARTAAQLALTKLANGQHAVLELTAGDRDAYLEARRLTDELGLPLLSAVEQLAHVHRKLNGRATVAEAVDYFCRHFNPDLPRKSVAEVVAEYLEERKGDSLSASYVRTAGIVLRRLVDAFGKAIGDVTAKELDAWLRGAGRSPRTRNNLRAQCITLFRYAKRVGYLPRDRVTEAELTHRAREHATEIEIFTPEEVGTILGAMRASYLPFVALGAFAGLRTEEVLRLAWEDVKFDQGVIEIRAIKSKTAQRRLVPIQPNLAAWLQPYRHHRGEICPHPKTQVSVQRDALKVGVAWKHNGLRHSFASYRLPIVKSAAELALEMGNSPRVVFANYRELVTEAAAAKFWATMPPR